MIKETFKDQILLRITLWHYTIYTTLINKTVKAFISWLLKLDIILL